MKDRLLEGIAGAVLGIVAAVLLLVLVGCGGPEEGTVVEKWYEEPREWTTTDMRCISYDDDGFCAIRIPVQNHHYDDEDWMLRVENEKGERGNVEVERYVWDRIRVGEYYAKGEW